SNHIGDDGVVIVRVEPATVANLSARLRIERRVIENDLAFLAGLEFVRALAVFEDGEYLAAFRARLPIALKSGSRQVLIRRVGSLLGSAFPGGASPLALLGHGAIEAVIVEAHPSVSCRILHEVKRKPKSIVKLESVLAVEDRVFRRVQ